MGAWRRSGSTPDQPRRSTKVQGADANGQPLLDRPIERWPQHVRAQFTTHFQTFGSLRRRRNELEYPTARDGDTTSDEADEACATSAAIIEAAGKLLPHLSFF